METIQKKGSRQINLSMIIGKNCKIYINQDYIIVGVIYSIDNFYNILLYNSYIIKLDKEFNLTKHSLLRFIRGEAIRYITFTD